MAIRKEALNAIAQQMANRLTAGELQPTTEAIVNEAITEWSNAGGFKQNVSRDSYSL